VRADEGLTSAAVATSRSTRRVRLRGDIATGAFWLLGSIVVALGQPNSDRRLAAAGAAVVGIATILIVSRLTQDPDRRYFRSILGAMVAVSVSGDWLVQHLSGGKNSFVTYGLDTRIALPLLFVLLTPLVLRELPPQLRSRTLWRNRALVWRGASPFDWLAVAYVAFALPDLILGIAHHAPKTYIAQDLGVIVFFVLAYAVGRTVSAEAGRAGSIELVDVLLLMAAAQLILGWGTSPIFTYVEAACAGAIGYALLRPRHARLLPLGLALVLLGADAIQVSNGTTGSTTAIELAAALGLIAYLVVRSRHLVPQWLVVAIAVVGLAGFLGVTSDGAGVLGRYYGTDPSKAGRTYEAHQVLATVKSSPVSFVFGRGLGGSIDETQAPRLFAESLAYGGRDLSRVQAVHLLPFQFLLKYGLLGLVWLIAFIVGVAILGVFALERASTERDPTLVVYAALPLLGIAAALAAASHLQDNPLNAFALGVLVTRLGAGPSSRFRLELALPAAALIGLVVGAIFVTRPSVIPSGGKFTYIRLPKSMSFGDLRFNYPLHGYHRRFFTSSNSAVTGGHGFPVHGVVVGSYPLKADPEVGGERETFTSNDVLFELYRVPRDAPGQVAQNTTLPLSYLDFPDGSLRFAVNGHTYQAYALVGKHASDSERAVIASLIGSIRQR
jgi:O-Antigen ligase